MGFGKPGFEGGVIGFTAGKPAAGFGAGTGTAAPPRYSLVLQGRGNGCQSAEDFTHWRLKVTGRKADYAFYGELADPD